MDGHFKLFPASLVNDIPAGDSKNDNLFYSAVPEFIDPVSVKTSPKRSFSMTKNERFTVLGLFSRKLGL
jgi:hypothetical protein